MPSPARFNLIAAGFLGFAGVALGAFGAHALRETLVAHGSTATWQTAVERWLEFLAKMPRKFRLAVLQDDEAGQQELLIAWYKETMQAHGKGVDIVEKDDISARLRLAHQILNEVELAYEGKKHLASELMAAKKRKG